MGDARGFLKFERQDSGHRSVRERVHDFREIDLPLSPDEIRRQAARCMDCGIPFCQGAGCPVVNCIPDFNELVYKDQWEQAARVLHETNNFPEITGRVCPAPCETACTLAVSDLPVTIKHIEYQIAERAFAEGWVKPLPPKRKTGRRVAVVGSGPAGLAAAQQLARAGHDVVVFEKDEKAGGMLRYGIPDFKLEKHIIDRRLHQLEAEGVEFQTGVHVGRDISAHYVRKMFDCVCLTKGARAARDLEVPGRDHEGIYFAMDFLTAQNKLCSAEPLGDLPRVNARDKVVVVIGGGDTGSDCIGTSLRQKAKKVYQLEILPKPPDRRPPDTPWPTWPRQMRTSSSQEEGCERMWSVMTKSFGGENGAVRELHACEVEWVRNDRGWQLKELPGTEFSLKADLVLLAMGFVHVDHEGLIKDFDLQLDAKGNVIVDDYQTSEPWVFAAGDTILGASLVVRAIYSGRQAAEVMDRWLRRST